ncbi:MAG: MBL fold metallo-hydrolase [Clostridia bacterium]|nr:MBL fold metallo-hydrolase [Clostridia bacterium]
MENFKLNFLGNGSCFNTEFGNNSAYYKVIKMENEEVLFDEKIYAKNADSCTVKLVIIDCGESVFERLRKNNILDGVNEVDIIITHLHSDHAGSLPSVIFYLNFVLGIKPNIIFQGNIEQYLDICSVQRELYNHKSASETDYIPIKVNHGNVKDACGYIINLPTGNAIYYSGDSNDIPVSVLDSFFGKDKSDAYKPICRIYQDVTRFENEMHMNVHKLEKIISKEYRDRVYCMHFDDEETVSIAKKYGFDVAII